MTEQHKYMRKPFIHLLKELKLLNVRWNATLISDDTMCIPRLILKFK